MVNLNETFAAAKFEFLESEGDKSEVDGVNILGKVRGVGFIVEGASRNKRYYSRELWNNAIEKSKERVKQRTMFGFLGHGSSNEDENLGNAALIVTKLEVPKSGHDGIIEYLIPATEAGRNLNALLRAGSALSVSTRATGTSTGKDSQGNEMLDPKTYDLHSIDIVQTPGVSKATPKLVETDLSGQKHTENNMANITIEKEEYEGLVAAKASLEVKLEAAVEGSSNSVDLESKLQDATDKLEALEGKIADLEKAATEASEAATAKDESLAAHEALGTVEDLTEKLELLAAYEEFGTAESIEIAFQSMEDKIAQGEDDSSAAAAESFATEHNIELDVAERLLEKFDDQEAADMAKSFAKPTRTSERYRSKPVVMSESGKDTSTHSAKHLL